MAADQERAPLLSDALEDDADAHQVAGSNASYIAYDQIATVPGQEGPLITYKRRWYILIVFGMMSCMQLYQCLAFSSIAASCEAAFGWANSDISMILNCIYISYLVAFFPLIWFVNAKGLRAAAIVCSVLSFAACAARAISVTPPAVTWVAYISQFLNGLAGPVAFMGAAVLSFTWFPVHERITATTLATFIGYFGAAFSFIVGPMAVRDPGEHVSTLNQSVIDDIRWDIHRLRYIECGVSGLILLAIVVYFPARPPTPPSVTASKPNLKIIPGLLQLYRRENGGFWLLSAGAAIGPGIGAVFMSLLDVNLKSIGVSENTAGWVGFYGVVGGCVIGVVFARAADYISGFLKVILLIEIAVCVVTAYWLLLVVNGYISYSTVSLYISAVVLQSMMNGTVPAMMELAMECTYPAPAALSTGVITLMFNITPPIFLLIFLIPNIGTLWMTWCQFIAYIVAFPLFLLVREEYRRRQVDETVQ